MRAPLHRNHALRHGLPPTHCEGFLRRAFVRPGVGRYYIAVGWLCDGCGAFNLDEDANEHIAEAKAWKRPESGPRRPIKPPLKHRKPLDGKPLKGE